MLLEVLGAEIEEIALEDEPTHDAILEHGPALEGEGIDQNEVDALLGDHGKGGGRDGDADARR